ncbi:MAG TPA: histidine kinase [Agriterribacter sp.]|nr:histidine kinase [Agriterribacter sp.]
MKMFNNPYRYLFVVCLGLYSWINTSFVQTFEYYGIQANRFSQVLGFLLVCLLVWEGNRFLEVLLKKYVFKKYPKLYPVPVFFAISHLIALTSGIVVYFFITNWVLHGVEHNRMIALKLTVLFSFRINLFLHCINAIVYYLNRFQQKQVEAEELRRINTQAELQAIRNQVNPHFLFNNLNVLSTLIMQKNHDANQFIEAFSSVYRYILKNRDNEAVLLKTELEFIEPYIYLLKTRFGNALDVVLEIPSPVPDVYILPAALQLLLENVIKHNIISTALPLHVKLFINGEGCLVVENNLQEKPIKPDSTEFGLYNINQRYRLLSGKEIKIDKTELHFSVAIPLLKVNDFKTNELRTG